MKTILQIFLIIIVLALVAATIFAVINADFSGLTEKIGNALTSASEWIYDKVYTLINE